ncbi:Rab effector [Collichthys lucidus]|uniref:Rab effector n=1 Tax=Collichthys lucidus TaxID=240159 RepID=A0A4U5VL07_COLLU|nr:Rab effector [Collichthys lucidus]
MKQELAEEGSRCSILSKQHRFNEHCCIRCCAPFTFLLNPKRLCLDCQYNVCKTCCTYSKRDKAWLCSACQKGRWAKQLEVFETENKALDIMVEVLKAPPQDASSMSKGKGR